LYELFQTKGSFYFVAQEENTILGGGGIYPTEGLPANTCELVKMYLHPNARGKGLGRQLIEHCLNRAKENGYEYCYLETMPELKQALKVYEQFGFTYLEGPMGNSGHFGCDRWMIKQL
jgi:putative acetyltransferase